MRENGGGGENGGSEAVGRARTGLAPASKVQGCLIAL